MDHETRDEVDITAQTVLGRSFVVLGENRRFVLGAPGSSAPKIVKLLWLVGDLAGCFRL
jgi:hypothetical protein